MRIEKERFPIEIGSRLDFACSASAAGRRIRASLRLFENGKHCRGARSKGNLLQRLAPSLILKLWKFTHGRLAFRISFQRNSFHPSRMLQGACKKIKRSRDDCQGKTESSGWTLTEESRGRRRLMPNRIAQQSAEP